MIDGVKVFNIKPIVDERGKIMHMMRNNDRHFDKFGEIYFSTVNPGVVKGWHIHSKMTLNYACVHGMIKLVLYDDRKGSDTRGEVQELFIGIDNYALVQIPPFVWNGFKGIGSEPAIVANCSDIPHDPTEIERLKPDIETYRNRIPYDWDCVNR